MSRSDSEPIRPRYNKLRVAKSPMQMKPATDDEEMGSKQSSDSPGRLWAARGDRWTKEPWETRDARNGRGSRTAHSSGEAGNDRGAKGLNRNMLLEDAESAALGHSLLRRNPPKRGTALGGDSRSIRLFWVPPKRDRIQVSVRAGCGKSARPVRRGASGRSPLAYSTLFYFFHLPSDGCPSVIG